MQPVLRIVLIAGAAYAAWLLGLFVFQRSLIYPGVSRTAPPLGEMPGRERVWLEGEGGRVEAWILAPTHERELPAPALLVATGNDELIDDWPPLVSGLRRRGWIVALVGYPGYGRSAGSPSQRSITEAMVAAYDELVGREEVDARRIVALGRSLGSGAVCALSRRRELSALVLTSPYTSLRAFAAGYLAPGFLVRDPFDNVSAVRLFPGPVLVAHGTLDDTIPWKHGKTLAAAAPNGRFLSYDADHDGTPPDWDGFWEEVEGWLRTERVPADRESPSSSSRSIALPPSG